MDFPQFLMNLNLTKLLFGSEWKNKRFSNKKKNPTTSKELNKELYVMKFSCKVMWSGNKGYLESITNELFFIFNSTNELFKMYI